MELSKAKNQYLFVRKMKLLLGLGLEFLVLLPIILGYFYWNNCLYSDDRCMNLKSFRFVALMVIFTGFCAVFGSLLHYMLPRKRASEGVVVVNEDTQNAAQDNQNDIEIANTSSAIKKHRISSTADISNNSSSGNNVVIGKEGENHSISATVAEVPIMTLGNSNQTDIDEDLHSRQLAVYGRETMRRLFASNILVSGMQGLGAEIGRIFLFFFFFLHFFHLIMIFFY